MQERQGQGTEEDNLMAEAYEGGQCRIDLETMVIRDKSTTAV